MFQVSPLVMYFVLLSGTSVPPVPQQEPLVLWKPCSNHIAVTAPRTILDEEGYERVRLFWEANVPQVRVTFVEENLHDGQATRVVVLDHTKLDSQTEFPLSGIFETMAGDEKKLCYTMAFIRMFSPFVPLSKERKEENFAHEIGHAIGLLHRDNTIMQKDGIGPWIVDEVQREVLRAHYSQPQP